MASTIMWFRRDLRVADNRAWAAAVDAARDAGGTVIPLFIVDPVLWDRSGANRRWFLRGALEDLDRSLEGGLVVRTGDPVEVLTDLAGDHDVTKVFRAQDVGVYGRQRDLEVADALGRMDVGVVEADSPWVVPAGTVRTGDGNAFKVFSAYHRQWRLQRLPRRHDAPRDVPTLHGIDGDELPDVTPTAELAALPEPGERAAGRALDAFLEARVDAYASERNVPAVDGTSRLSPYLRFGCLHPRQVMRRLDGRRADHDTFAKELAWRDFYADVLHERPDSAWHAWNPAMAAMPVDRGARADERFAAWCEGRTGFPIVDAGMRQLVATGWMHNRLRMITASFLVKDLHLDWTRGARFFLQHLVDGDLPSNNHGWQWVAGTGTDAAPYFRVFNPTTQSTTFDPDGDYIRRWVPELADVADKAVHDPTRLERPPAGYPAPIVDHAAERAESLARYRSLRTATRERSERSGRDDR